MNQKESDVLEQYILMLSSLFHSETQIKPIINVQVEFVDDLYSRRLELAYNEKEKQSILDAKAFLINCNGTMVLPEHINNNPYILISKKLINSEGAFFHTFCHELTHVYDFYDFAKVNNVELFQLIESHKYFGALYHWSEFHARRNGYFLYRKAIDLLLDDKILDKEHLNHIINVEYPTQLDYLIKQLWEHVDSPTQFIYNIMQFLGRYSVWEDMFPEHFNSAKLPQTLINGFGKKINELYSFLQSNIKFDDVKYQFDKLEVIIKKFVTE